MSKRRRDPTFSTSEKDALLEIIVRHFSIVESKKTDAVSIKNKIEEWRKIATEFNAISSIHPREWSVLKNCWENLKKRAKLEQTLRNQHFLRTGGGPPRKESEDPILNRVLDLIQARVSGFVNGFDSDGTYIIACGGNAETHTSQTEILCKSDVTSHSCKRTNCKHICGHHYIRPVHQVWQHYPQRLLGAGGQFLSVRHIIILKVLMICVSKLYLRRMLKQRRNMQLK